MISFVNQTQLIKQNVLNIIIQSTTQSKIVLLMFKLNAYSGLIKD